MLASPAAAPAAGLPRLCCQATPAGLPGGACSRALRAASPPEAEPPARGGPCCGGNEGSRHTGRGSQFFAVSSCAQCRA
jgi:hypothetical protein